MRFFIILILFSAGCAKNPLLFDAKSDTEKKHNYKVVIDNYDGPYYYQEEYTYDLIFN